MVCMMYTDCLCQYIDMIIWYFHDLMHTFFKLVLLQVMKTKLISSRQEFYLPNQCQFNIALKYSETESCFCVLIFRCRLRGRKIWQYYLLNNTWYNIHSSLTHPCHQVPQITLEESSKLYSKIILLMDSKELVSKKQSKCFQNEHILDFSEEHK